MRINSRLIRNATKRSPDELQIELKKRRKKHAINYISKTIADFITVLTQAYEADSATFKRIVYTANNDVKK